MRLKPARRASGRNLVITITTDFGGTHYQGVIQGIIYSVNPQAKIVTITQDVRPQDIRGAAFVMRATLPFYPYGVHLGLVFPTVGLLGAKNIVVRCKRGILIGPDNGILMPAARELGLETVYEVSNPRFWPSPSYNTFPAVDTCAPLAAYLSMGLRPEEVVGPKVETWVDMQEPAYRQDGEALEGEIIFADIFGNLITNIPSRDVAKLASYGDVLEVECEGKSVKLPLLKRSGSAPKGGILATLNSYGLLEIAAYCDSASRVLEVENYAAIKVSRVKREEELLEGLPS